MKKKKDYSCCPSMLTVSKRWGQFLPRMASSNLTATTFVGLGRAGLGLQKCLIVDTFYIVDPRARPIERDGEVALEKQEKEIISAKKKYEDFY